MEEHVPCSENSQRRIKAGIQERKDRIKTLLKEEFPQKLMGKIDKIGGSQGKIDRYISRITGIEIKIISTARAWHKILKEIIIEEEKTILDIALEELEQELQVKTENLKKELEIGKKEEPEAINPQKRSMQIDKKNLISQKKQKSIRQMAEQNPLSQKKLRN